MARAGAQDIAQQLRLRIDSGEWQRVPPERDLATTFGVARNTVRRAMALLEQDGAIARHVGRGTFVQNNGSGSATLAQAIARMEGASPADVMELRLMLEPSAAAFAATDASASDLDAVAEAHERAIASTEIAEFERWDSDFHHRIVSCSRNGLLREINDILRTLRDKGSWLDMKRRSFSEQRRVIYCAEHKRIFDALMARDPEAASQTMRAHLLTVRTNLLGR